MLYAKVVVGLPVEGPFDYLVGGGLAKRIKTGSRVRVHFGSRELIGYVVGLCSKTDIKGVKPILGLLDDFPILSENLLLLTKELSQYYCCSWGEAVEAALPPDLRKGRQVLLEQTKIDFDKCPGLPAEVSLIHDAEGKERWEIYLDDIRIAQSQNRSSLILFSDINSAIKAQDKISSVLGLPVAILYRRQPKELSEWLKIKKQELNIAVGTRSAIFAPFDNLALIIIDEEQDTVYKQDQVPHYHARDIAFMRSRIENVKFLMASKSPSLEAIYLARKGKIKYILAPKVKIFPQIDAVDITKEHFGKNRPIFSRYLQDAIASSLNAGKKILLFLNRKGFATSAFCRNCSMSLKCPRCNVNLVFYFQENILSCHFCNYKMDPPQICPNCNSSYIRYSGAGTEKIESELSRIFPQAKIRRLKNKEEKEKQKAEADIFVATESVVKNTDRDFGFIGILSLDNLLNRIDFRAGEKAFNLLTGIASLTQKKILIQTRLFNHHALTALINNNPDIFYGEELRQRRQLGFPPYKHLGLIKLRARSGIKVMEAANKLFKRLLQQSKAKSLKVIAVNPAQPAKLRGNFYWQILLKFSNPVKAGLFLKTELKSFPHSGIIVTVDIDPI